jgi:hypothetical protein
MGLKITQAQVDAFSGLYADHSAYIRSLRAYLFCAQTGLIQKHYTDTSVFFIIEEIRGFKTVTFHNDGMDIRVSGYSPSLAEAYTTALVTYV